MSNADDMLRHGEGGIDPFARAGTPLGYRRAKGGAPANGSSYVGPAPFVGPSPYVGPSAPIDPRRYVDPPRQVPGPYPADPAAASPDLQVAPPLTDPALVQPAEGPVVVEQPAPPPAPEYPDLADANGRPVGEIAYFVALALAAGADVAAFHQVISLVMRRQADWIVWMMVLGFTAAALTLAHFAGRVWKDLAAGRPSASKGQVAASLLPWIALGLVAFTVRLTIDDPTGSSFGGVSVGDISVGGIAGSNQRLASALMFLGLYAASGAVAGIGAYLTRNPLRVGYRHAVRAHNRALQRLAQSQPPYERAVRVMHLQQASRRHEEQNWQAARQWRIAYSDAMKRYAAMLMAAQVNDPRVADAVPASGRRPVTAAPTPPYLPAMADDMAPRRLGGRRGRR